MKKQRRVFEIPGRGSVPLFTAALMAAGVLSQARVQAQLQSAGDVFVKVDATSLTEGPLSTIPNTGTLGGVFEATGGGDTVPKVATIGGTKAIQFDGNDFMQLVSGAGGALITAPAGLTGEDPSRSIEVWALNPDVAGEETLVSWGHRGGPDGSNLSFGYGSDFRWGAVGHWGIADLGWSNDGGNPPANKWHHLVYTMEPNATTGITTSRVYVDGTLSNGEYLPAALINTFPDTPINLASQTEPDGTTPTGGLRLSGAIARVRIHDGVLTPAQILANYNAEKAAFIDPTVPVTPTVTPERLAGGPTHRYSFSDAATTAEGATFKDSVGSADGTIVGPGGELTGSRLKLPGGPSAEAPYGDLPNGLLSQNSTNNGGTGEFTFETWVKITGSRTWSRIFDFGDSNGEEVTSPGGGGNGLDYLELSAQIGDDVNSRRLEIRNENPSGGGTVTADLPTRSAGKDTHVVVTWNEKTGAVDLYENGLRIGGFVTDDAMSDINDVNVWLGRSNWTADQNTQGEYDEVRIYNSVLTPGEVLGNFQAGPDNLNDHDFGVMIAAQPQDSGAVTDGTASFSVNVTGSSPISYQWLRDGALITGETNRTLTLKGISAADNNVSFSVRVSNTVNGTPVTVTSSAAKLTVAGDTLTLKHRYSFNETSGTDVTDSVGGANGTVLGAGTFGGGQLTLDGSDGTYVDLPNGIITALGQNMTIEMWTTYMGGNGWARVFDFGTSDVGEDASGTGTDYLFYTSRTGDGYPRFEVNMPGTGVTTLVNHPGATPLNEEEHIVITYSYTGNIARIYTNGTLVATAPGVVPQPISALNNEDVNVWLGRSQFNDPYWNGKYNEFRIYQGAMTPQQVAASFAAGPNALPAQDTQPTITVQKNANTLVVSWPDSVQGFHVESTPVLGAGATWTSVGDGTPATGGKFQVTVPIDQNARFLRLKK